MRLTGEHTAGAVLVMLSAILFSTAGIFTRAITADVWQIIFWRGLAAAVFTLAYLLWRAQLGREISAFGGPALLAVGFGAAGSVAFIQAFKLTSVANVAVIYGAAPFLAAGISWLVLRERPAPVIIVASFAALVGVWLVVAASFGGDALAGDALALFMTLMMAAMMVVYRRWPDTTAALPAVMMSAVLLPLAAVLGDVFAVTMADLALMLIFGLVFAVASVSLLAGARRLSAPETALLSTLEVPFAPIWAFVILSEVPVRATVSGGVIILGAVLLSQAGPFRRR